MEKVLLIFTDLFCCIITIIIFLSMFLVCFNKCSLAGKHDWGLPKNGHLLIQHTCKGLAWGAELWAMLLLFVLNQINVCVSNLPQCMMGTISALWTSSDINCSLQTVGCSFTLNWPLANHWPYCRLRVNEQGSSTSHKLSTTLLNTRHVECLFNKIAMNR